MSRAFKVGLELEPEPEPVTVAVAVTGIQSRAGARSVVGDSTEDLSLGLGLGSDNGHGLSGEVHTPRQAGAHGARR